MARDDIQGIAAGIDAQTERLRDGSRNKGGIAERRQIDEERAVPQTAAQRFRRAQGQPGLSGSAGADERHQGVVTHEVDDVGQLPGAADEAGR